MKKMFYVYLLKDPNGVVFYVGKGSGDRVNRHVSISKGNSKKKLANLKLYNKIFKIIKNGKFIQTEIVFTSFDENECLEKEVALIKEIGLKKLCNLTIGGEGTSGYKQSEEAKKKMSNSKMGHKPYEVSEESRKKMSNAAKKRGFKPWKNKKLTKETKLKMSKAKKGKKTGPISEKRRLAIIQGIKKIKNGG